MRKLNQRKNRKRTCRKRGSRVRKGCMQKGGAFQKLVVFCHGMFNTAEPAQPIIQIPYKINLYYRGGLGTVCMVPNRSDLYDGKIARYCENRDGVPFNSAEPMSATPSVYGPGYSTGLPVRVYKSGMFFPNLLLQFDATVGLEYWCDQYKLGLDGAVSPTGYIRLTDYLARKLYEFPSGVNIQLSCCGENIPPAVLARVEQLNSLPPPSYGFSLY